MRFLVVSVADGIEIHGPACTEAGEGGIVSAPNPFGAAIEYWARHKTALSPERMAFERSYIFPCGAEQRATGTARRSRRAVPFELDASDGEILTAVMGRRIKWLNERTGREEDARLYADGPHEKLLSGRVITSFPHNHTHIKVTSAGHRVLSFLDAGGTGFRATRIESIVSVR